MRILTSAVCVLLVASAGCSKDEGKPAATIAPAAQAAASIPVAQMPRVDEARILEHIKALSSDDMEGRAPGTAGEEKTVAYLETQFKQIGLQPGNPDGTFIQKVPLVGITGTDRQPLTFTKDAQRIEVKWKD